MRVPRPPRLAESLIGALVEREDREFALGDLAQEYAERRRRHGWILARGWYWTHAVRTMFGSGGGGAQGGRSAAPYNGGRTGRTNAGLVDEMLRDVRHAVRSFAHAPGFTAAAVMTLALGMGATTTVFSLADAVLLGPIPGIEEPEELALVWSCGAELRPGGCTIGGITYPNFLDIQRRLGLIAGLAAYGSAGDAEVVTGDGVPRNLRPLYVTASYFDVLGASPYLGRTFTEDEDGPSGGAPVVVISHRMWRTLFGRSPDVLGRQLLINGHTLTVIGVAPPGFRGVSRGGRDDLWLTASTMHWINRWSLDRSDRRSGRTFGYYVARRSSGASWEQVRAELDSFIPWLAEQYPAENAAVESVTFRVFPGLGELAPGAAGAVSALSAVVGLILLIACSNVAGLLIIKGLRRRGEVAVRKALGASRGRLLRQHLTESALLWLAGGAAGGLLTYVLIRVAEWRAPMSAVELSMDLRVMAFTAVLSLVVGLMFGALPALGAARVDAARWLGQAAPAATRGRRWIRSALSVTQLAATLALLVGALLMARTLNALYGIDLGFEPDRVTVFEVSLGEERFDDASRVRYYREMARRLRADPGVVAASTARWVPFATSGISTSARVAGEDEARAREALMTYVGPGYFSVMQIPVVTGRGFTDGEVFTSAPSEVVILSLSLARSLFGEADPLGQLVQFPRGRYAERRYRVVGVVGDVRFSSRSMTEGFDPLAYRPFGGDGTVPAAASFVVRARPGVADTARLIRSTAETLDAELPVIGLQAQLDLVNRFYGGSVMIASLTGAMSLLASILAAIGLYGVVGVSATERMREFGIRTALGADRRALFNLVAHEAMSIVFPGLLAGLIGAFALGIVIEGFLYGVSPLDPVSWVLATAMLACVTVAAIILPVRRATSVDPVKVLRSG